MTRGDQVVWLLVAAAVLVQICYPLMSASLRNPVTMLSVVVFAAASIADAARVHGPRGAAALVVAAGGIGLAAETIGVSTGFPFGSYAYADTLGPRVLDVPLIVPLAWTMMAWPALNVGRTLARSGWAVVAVAAVALASWDVFLDPQMVGAGHWRWLDPGQGLPLVPGVPLTNYAGWLAVAALVVAALYALLGAAQVRTSKPAAVLYLWVYASSVVAHVAFFGLPGSALLGGLVMGSVALPFARAVAKQR
ncbi:MAG TPA: carotenoid biosynthesis protein [Pseudonocardia sp.]